MIAGRFLSLEGGEGAGKSTQAMALAQALERRGLSVLVTREPGGSAGAEAIRELLMHGTAERWSAQAEALLFAAARSDHVDKVIRPAITSGRWVVCDRYLDSSRAYQGIAGGIEDAAVLALHGFGSGGLLPDRTFVLDLLHEAGRGRAAMRDGAAADRFAGREAAYHAAVNDAFRRFAAAEPERVRLVVADGAPELVTARLLDAVADLLP